MSLPSPTSLALAGSERVGEILVKAGLLSEEQIRAALEHQLRSGKRLGRILVEEGFITEARLVNVLSSQLNIEICDPITAPIHPRILELVPTELATELRVIPLALKRADGNKVLLLATSDPTNHVVFERLEKELGLAIEWRLAGATEIDLGIARHYGPQAAAPTVLGVPSTPPPGLAGTSLPLPPVPADIVPEPPVRPSLGSVPRPAIRSSVAPRSPSVPAQSWADMVPGDSWPVPEGPAPGIQVQPAAPIAPPSAWLDPEARREEAPRPETSTEVELPAVPTPDEARTDGPASPTAPVDEVAEIAADTQVAIERFARNEEIDAATTSWVLRVAVAYLLEHGLSDPVALERAVRTVLRSQAEPPASRAPSGSSARPE
ncbi:MAG: hypothetical protein HYV07_04970 [Deltaproteobacteria bacterium]|nr:hypothetical protein [Deltaproteobacteria bacterium]